MSEPATHENIVTCHIWPACFYPFWSAHFDGEEERGQYGSGPTQQAAIDDLITLYGDEKSPKGAS